MLLLCTSQLNYTCYCLFFLPRSTYYKALVCIPVLLPCLSFMSLKSLSYSALTFCMSATFPPLSGWCFLSRSLYCFRNSCKLFTLLKYFAIPESLHNQKGAGPQQLNRLCTLCMATIIQL